MKEEADAGVGQPLPEQIRQQQQLVVVHPDEVTRLVVLGHDVGESLVHLHVRVPVADVERHLIEEVVEQRPEDPVGEPLVVAGDLIRGQRHRHQPHGGELLLQLGLLRGGQLLRRPGPSDPQPARLLVRPEQPGGQSTGAPLDLDPILGGFDRDRQAVGDDQDARHVSKVPVTSRVESTVTGRLADSRLRLYLYRGHT